MINKLIHRIKNILKKDKDKFDYSKFGCIPDEPDDRDYIWEDRLETKDIKCDFYREREK